MSKSKSEWLHGYELQKHSVSATSLYSGKVSHLTKPYNAFTFFIVIHQITL